MKRYTLVLIIIIFILGVASITAAADNYRRDRNIQEISEYKFTNVLTTFTREFYDIQKRNQVSYSIQIITSPYNQTRNDLLEKDFKFALEFHEEFCRFFLNKKGWQRIGYYYQENGYDVVNIQFRYKGQLKPRATVYLRDKKYEKLQYSESLEGFIEKVADELEQRLYDDYGLLYKKDFIPHR